MKNLPYILIIVLILGLIGFLVISPTNEQTTNPENLQEKMMEEENGLNTNGHAEEGVTKQATYTAYSKEAVTAASAEDLTLLFFHADWCPTCRAAEKDIMQNQTSLPDNLTVLKTDYDTNRDLRTRYSLTSQHAFVLVDNEGNEVSKWYGGGVKTILENLN